MLERKGFGIRLGALVIDGVILMVLYFILNAIFGVKVSITGTETFEEVLVAAQKSVSRTWIIQGILGLILGAIEISTAQTPGKMLLKLKVMSETGTPATKNQLVMRSLIKYGAYAFYLVAGILGLHAISYLGGLVGLVFLGGSFVALGASKQALHDMLGKTAVFGPATVMQSGFQPVAPGQPVTGQTVAPPSVGQQPPAV